MERFYPELTLKIIQQAMDIFSAMDNSKTELRIEYSREMVAELGLNIEERNIVPDDYVGVAAYFKYNENSFLCVYTWKHSGEPLFSVLSDGIRNPIMRIESAEELKKEIRMGYEYLSGR